MRRNIAVRAYSLYVALFVFAAAAAQAATPRAFDPSARQWWQTARQFFGMLRGVLDTIRIPIG